MNQERFYGHKLALLVFMLTVLGACVPASDISNQSSAGEDESLSGAPAVEPAGEDDGEKVADVGAEVDPIVCKRIAEIGTKIQKKTCMRQSQWDQQNGSGSELTSEWQRKGNLVGNPSGE